MGAMDQYRLAAAAAALLRQGPTALTEIEGEATEERDILLLGKCMGLAERELETMPLEQVEQMPGLDSPFLVEADKEGQKAVLLLREALAL